MSERRREELLALPATDMQPGVFEWASGLPCSGQRCFLVYNVRRPGQLQNSSSVQLHLGYDGWYKGIKEVCCVGGEVCVCVGGGH